MDTEPKAREGARRPRKRRRQEDGPNKVSVSKLKKKVTPGGIVLTLDSGCTTIIESRKFESKCSRGSRKRIGITQ